MKTLKEFENLVSLSQNEMRELQGGDITYSYTDDEGYKWSYTYDDAGNLVGMSVVRCMIY